jgi:hypothetical protein
MPPIVDEVWFFLVTRKTEHWSLLVSASGVAVAIIALRRWAIELRWKRKEALFSFVDSFLDTPGAQNAMMMLHTKSREVPLWDKGTPEDRWVRVTWDAVSAAFTPGSENELPTGPFDTAIRDCFGDFFVCIRRRPSVLMC